VFLAPPGHSVSDSADFGCDKHHVGAGKHPFSSLLATDQKVGGSSPYERAIVTTIDQIAVAID
jgi:hypothetical protein